MRSTHSHPPFEPGTGHLDCKAIWRSYHQRDLSRLAAAEGLAERGNLFYQLGRRLHNYGACKLLKHHSCKRLQPCGSTFVHFRKPRPIPPRSHASGFVCTGRRYNRPVARRAIRFANRHQRGCGSCCGGGGAFAGVGRCSRALSNHEHPYCSQHAHRRRKKKARNPVSKHAAGLRSTGFTGLLPGNEYDCIQRKL